MRNLLSSVFLALIINILIFGSLSIPSDTKTSEQPFIRLRDIFNRVERRLESRGVKPVYTILVFDSSMKGIVGRAIRVTPFLGYIIISTKHFAVSSDEVMEALILHEYAHVLGYNREDSVHYSFRAGLCPASVMHPSDDMEGCFYRFRNYYYSEVIKHLTKN